MSLLAYIADDDAPGKKRILASALRLFVQRGLCETTIRDIAAEAGCSNPALFKHFAGKDALALHLFEACYLAQFQAASWAISSHERFGKKQKALIATCIKELHRDSDAVLFVQENLRHFWPRANAAIRKHSILALVRQMLLEGVREGVVTDKVDVEFLVMAWLGTIQQFARVWYFGGLRLGEEAIVQQIHAVLLRMVKS